MATRTHNMFSVLDDFDSDHDSSHSVTPSPSPNSNNNINIINNNNTNTNTGQNNSVSGGVVLNGGNSVSLIGSSMMTPTPGPIHGNVMKLPPVTTAATTPTTAATNTNSNSNTGNSTGGAAATGGVGITATNINGTGASTSTSTSTNMTTTVSSPTATATRQQHQQQPQQQVASPNGKTTPVLSGRPVAAVGAMRSSPILSHSSNYSLNNMNNGSSIKIMKSPFAQVPMSTFGPTKSISTPSIAPAAKRPSNPSSFAALSTALSSSPLVSPSSDVPDSPASSPSSSSWSKPKTSRRGSRSSSAASSTSSSVSLGLSVHGSSREETPSELTERHNFYMYKFRTEYCPDFPSYKCDKAKPFSCTLAHYENHLRRKPKLGPNGKFNYTATLCVYPSILDCPDGQSCRLSHRVQKEHIYHPSVYKTQFCESHLNPQGACTEYGRHCSKAHGENDLREPVYEVTDSSVPSASSASVPGTGVGAGGPVAMTAHADMSTATELTHDERELELGPGHVNGHGDTDRSEENQRMNSNHVGLSMTEAVPLLQQQQHSQSSDSNVIGGSASSTLSVSVPSPSNNPITPPTVALPSAAHTPILNGSSTSAHSQSHPQQLPLQHQQAGPQQYQFKSAQPQTTPISLHNQLPHHSPLQALSHPQQFSPQPQPPHVLLPQPHHPLQQQQLVPQPQQSSSFPFYVSQQQQQQQQHHPPHPSPLGVAPRSIPGHLQSQSALPVHAAPVPLHQSNPLQMHGQLQHILHQQQQQQHPQSQSQSQSKAQTQSQPHVHPILNHGHGPFGSPSSGLGGVVGNSNALPNPLIFSQPASNSREGHGLGLDKRGPFVDGIFSLQQQHSHSHSHSQLPAHAVTHQHGLFGHGIGAADRPMFPNHVSFSQPHDIAQTLSVHSNAPASLLTNGFPTAAHIAAAAQKAKQQHQHQQQPLHGQQLVHSQHHLAKSNGSLAGPPSSVSSSTSPGTSSASISASASTSSVVEQKRMSVTPLLYSNTQKTTVPQGPSLNAPPSVQLPLMPPPLPSLSAAHARHLQLPPPPAVQHGGRNLNQKPEHERYMYGFRTRICAGYRDRDNKSENRIETDCNNDSHACFDSHARVPRRRKPQLQHGRFNYIPTRCRYILEDQECPQGVHCRFAHSTEEVIYHPSKYKTQLCSHSLDANGHCSGYGMHCAKAHGEDDRRQPIFEDTEESNNNHATSEDDVYEWVCPETEREEERNLFMYYYKTRRCSGFPWNCQCNGMDYHRPEERRRGPKIVYAPAACPNVKPYANSEWGDPDSCPNAEECEFAHTLLELMYHPQVYKTSLCDHYDEHDVTKWRCVWKRRCAHAHGRGDLRVKGDDATASLPPAATEGSKSGHSVSSSLPSSDSAAATVGIPATAPNSNTASAAESLLSVAGRSASPSRRPLSNSLFGVSENSFNHLSLNGDSLAAVGGSNGGGGTAVSASAAGANERDRAWAPEVSSSAWGPFDSTRRTAGGIDGGANGGSNVTVSPWGPTGLALSSVDHHVTRPNRASSMTSNGAGGAVGDAAVSSSSSRSTMWFSPPSSQSGMSALGSGGTNNPWESPSLINDLQHTKFGLGPAALPGNDSNNGNGNGNNATASNAAFTFTHASTGLTFDQPQQPQTGSGNSTSSRVRSGASAVADTYAFDDPILAKALSGVLDQDPDHTSLHHLEAPNLEPRDDSLFTSLSSSLHSLTQPNYRSLPTADSTQKEAGSSTLSSQLNQFSRDPDNNTGSSTNSGLDLEDDVDDAGAAGSEEAGMQGGDSVVLAQQLCALLFDQHARNIVHYDGTTGWSLDCITAIQSGVMVSEPTLETTNTQVWMAPELLIDIADSNSNKQNHTPTKASDVFSVGSVLCYVLTGGRHPFDPVHETFTGSQLQVARIIHHVRVCGSNLKPWFSDAAQGAGEASGGAVDAGAGAGAGDRMSPAAAHLLSNMLSATPQMRLSAGDVLRHPYFWTVQQQMRFTRCVAQELQRTSYSGKATEKGNSNGNGNGTKVEDDSAFVRDLDAFGTQIVPCDPSSVSVNWKEQVHSALYDLISRHVQNTSNDAAAKADQSPVSRSSNPFDDGSVASLLRFVGVCLTPRVYQSLPSHVVSLFSPSVRTPAELDPVSVYAYFSARFPSLFITLYSLTLSHAWRQSHSSVEEFFQQPLPLFSRHPSTRVKSKSVSSQRSSYSAAGSNYASMIAAADPTRHSAAAVSAVATNTSITSVPAAHSVSVVAALQCPIMTTNPNVSNASRASHLLTDPVTSTCCGWSLCRAHIASVAGRPDSDGGDIGADAIASSAHSVPVAVCQCGHAWDGAERRALQDSKSNQLLSLLLRAVNTKCNFD